MSLEQVGFIVLYINYLFKYFGEMLQSIKFKLLILHIHIVILLLWSYLNQNK